MRPEWILTEDTVYRTGRCLLITVVVLLTLLTGVAARAEDATQAGVVVTPDELSRLSITVFPDGRGLPEGTGNATTGTKVYQTHCLACHGAGGQDGINDALSGGAGTLVSTRPKRTVGSYWPYATSLFDYIRRAMPYNTPGSLSNDDLYAVTAYLLHINRIIPADKTLNATTLPAVVMPNRDGFIWPEVAPLTQSDNPVNEN